MRLAGGVVDDGLLAETRRQHHDERRRRDARLRQHDLFAVPRCRFELNGVAAAEDVDAEVAQRFEMGANPVEREVDLQADVLAAQQNRRDEQQRADRGIGVGLRKDAPRDLRAVYVQYVVFPRQRRAELPGDLDQRFGR